MTLCQLSEEMKVEIQNKLEDIKKQVEAIVNMMEGKEGCLLCEITTVVNLTRELEVLTSFYHFQSSLLPHLEGLDEIIKALAVLSDKRHGALVAVEQKDNLDNFLIDCNTTGVSIGAKVSGPLLQAIFYPGNPLHDGAVVIRHGEITSAGCIFPLSEQKVTKEGRKLGTRHRAALGLSEKTDAVVIVVSEETGQVSFALNGILHPIEVSLCERGKEPQVNLKN